jgi:hypothetical protein
MVICSAKSNTRDPRIANQRQRKRSSHLRPKSTQSVREHTDRSAITPETLSIAPKPRSIAKSQTGALSGNIPSAPRHLPRNVTACGLEHAAYVGSHVFDGCERGRGRWLSPARYRRGRRLCRVWVGRVGRLGTGAEHQRAFGAVGALAGAARRGADHVPFVATRGRQRRHGRHARRDGHLGGGRGVPVTHAVSQRAVWWPGLKRSGRGWWLDVAGRRCTAAVPILVPSAVAHLPVPCPSASCVEGGGCGRANVVAAFSHNPRPLPPPPALTTTATTTPRPAARACRRCLACPRSCIG